VTVEAMNETIAEHIKAGWLGASPDFLGEGRDDQGQAARGNLDD
jgi:hypothetical protein